MKHLLSVVMIFFIVSSCTQLGAYRTNLYQLKDSSRGTELVLQNNTLPGEWMEAEKKCRHEERPRDAYFMVRNSKPRNSENHIYNTNKCIPLAIIEFDDQGVLQNRSYKDEILDRIRQETEKEDARILTVVYAHGWWNNAEFKNENLTNFQMLLQDISQDVQWDERRKGRKKENQVPKVIGVYLAWRGQSIPEPFSVVSFWSRKNRAEYIGRHGATEVLSDLKKIHAGEGPKKRLIFIGHSLGGSLLYSATQQILMNNLSYEDIGQNMTGKTNSIHRNVADLIVLLNPAFEAARFTAIREKTLRMDFHDLQSPILAMFTSETDFATEWLFWLGRLYTFLTPYNTETHKDQARLDRTAVGHFAEYQTHELYLEKEENKKVECGQNITNKWNDFMKDRNIKCWSALDVVLQRMPSTDKKNKKYTGEKQCKVQEQEPRKKKGKMHLNPYYNVRVANSIISGHSGIWESEEFRKFIAKFIKVQN